MKDWEYKYIYIISKWLLAHFVFNRWFYVSCRQKLEAYRAEMGLN